MPEPPRPDAAIRGQDLTAVALIPARGGSTRVPGKNVAPLAGHPLIAYTIAAAQESGCFDAIVCSTDDQGIAAVAAHYGAAVPGLRPPELAGTRSPDIDWVRHTLAQLAQAGQHFDLFSILRPTSPFRTGQTIRRAWDALMAVPGADSVRAVRPVREHPGKMWMLDGELMRPLLAQAEGETPTHSRQFQDLPEVWVQDSSLEIAWTRVVAETATISGHALVPFFPEGYEGASIDYPDDLAWCEAEADAGRAPLPQITRPPYQPTEA